MTSVPPIPDEETAPPAGRMALCADLSRSAGEDPIGTAPHWAEVTVLELAVPVWAQLRTPERWTPAQQAVFEGLRGKVEASGAGFGLLMSAPDSPDQPLAVRHYTRSGQGFVRQDYQSELPQSEWAQGLHDTLMEPARLRDWHPREVPAGPDLHVCTHGSVDAACGKYGVPVYQGLRGAGLRGWRTGHFGGHRFAATAVELPTGLVWAHLSPDLAVRVLRRKVAPAEVRLHLRGNAALPPLAQVLDRELLIERGWDWLSAERHAEVRGADVTLTYSWAGQQGTVRARVEETGRLDVAGSSHKPNPLTVPQYRVTELQHQGPGR
ncbi:sucrase ferredoxin [Deinococcus hohokamensis]|uniref:Sucrase ferredoxin n=1 Tax=Deinococcus hohokamensis TaxID=309883 RepID=A0ABV9IDM3_9DEIO